MPIGDQDHGRIAVTMAARLAGRRRQRLDLSAGQILPGPGNWGIYDAWCPVLDLPETHGKALPYDLTREVTHIFSSVLKQGFRRGRPSRTRDPVRAPARRPADSNRGRARADNRARHPPLSRHWCAISGGPDAARLRLPRAEAPPGGPTSAARASLDEKETR